MRGESRISPRISPVVWNHHRPRRYRHARLQGLRPHLTLTGSAGRNHQPGQVGRLRQAEQIPRAGPLLTRFSGLRKASAVIPDHPSDKTWNKDYCDLPDQSCEVFTSQTLKLSDRMYQSITSFRQNFQYVSSLKSLNTYITGMTCEILISYAMSFAKTMIYP